MGELTPNQRSAVQRARRVPELRRILFRKAKGVQWYGAFVEAGFINPTEIPRPVPAEDPGFVAIPPWPITEYLVATSEDLSKPENRECALQILDFMRATTTYAREQGFGNYRAWWQFSKIIRHIPLDLMTVEDVRHFSYWLDDPHERGFVAEGLGEHWLPRILDRTDDHAHELAISVLDILYRVRVYEKSSGDSTRKIATLRSDSWHAKKITKAIAGKTGRALGAPAVELFKSRLETVLTELGSDRWSALWRPAIEDHEQNQSAEDAEDTLVEGLRDALVAYSAQEPDAARSYVAALLESPFQTLRRVAIYSIDQRFELLNGLVARVLDAAFFEGNFRHELWHLLERHYPAFSQDQKNRTLQIIESLEERNEDGSMHVLATAHERARWLSSLKGHGGEVRTQYDQYLQVIGKEPEHPDFASYTSSGWRGSESPIPLDDLRAMDVPTLVHQLTMYRDPGKLWEPGLEGVAKALRQVIKADPMRYHKELMQFRELDLAYLYELIEAFSDLWKDNPQLQWDDIWPNLLAFCENLISQERFWTPENARERSHFVANRYWIVGGIGRFIESGTQSDEHAFAETLLPIAERVLTTLLDKEKGEEFKLESDAVSIAINGPRGRCLEALINLTLRACRLSDRTNGTHAEVWAHFQARYDAELGRADHGEYEFLTLLANYLPNFLYLSKDWVLTNLGKIFDGNQYQKWLCAMQAYAYVNRVYREIYDHLKNGGHFARALDDPHLKKRVDEKIVQNIAISYLMSVERLEDPGSLLNLLLERRKLEELSHLIWFFWTLRKEEEDEEVLKKIFALWSRLLAVMDTTTREGRRLARRLGDWAVFVRDVDDVTRPLLLGVAPFAGDESHSSELLESIARFSERQPQEAYEIWAKVLETSYPDYPIEAAQRTLSNIARMRDEGPRKAKAIVSRYLAAGYDEIQGVWTEIQAAMPPGNQQQ